MFHSPAQRYPYILGISWLDAKAILMKYLSRLLNNNKKTRLYSSKFFLVHRDYWSEMKKISNEFLRYESRN